MKKSAYELYKEQCIYPMAKEFGDLLTDFMFNGKQTIKTEYYNIGKKKEEVV